MGRVSEQEGGEESKAWASGKVSEQFRHEIMILIKVRSEYLKDILGFDAATAEKMIQRQQNEQS